jgi:glycosyltransferase involved in cell wall biosynthesis
MTFAESPPPAATAPERDWPSATVVICVYTERRWDDIVAAVESVLGQDYPGEVEVLLVVDHNDLLLERLRREVAGVRVIESTGTKGLAGGRNSGIADARGEVVVFLDDDAYGEPGWLQALIAPYRDASVISTGGLIVPHWPAERPRWFPPEFDWVVGCSYRGLPTQVTEVRNVIGANMSFRATALQEAGAFSEGLGRVGTLPLGCEETEICIRARRRLPAARILHVPEAVVHHRVTDDRLTTRYFFHRCWSEGLSKGAVAELAGSEAALATERRYSTRTLPAGCLRGIGALMAGDVYGPVRAAMIIAGLFTTAAGYVVGRRRLAAQATRAITGDKEEPA